MSGMEPERREADGPLVKGPVAGEGSGRSSASGAAEGARGSTSTGALGGSTDKGGQQGGK
eukprot:812435-Pelagomonas_calceolata.AAC.1